MEVQELKNKKRELEVNIYYLILGFIQETEVSGIHLRLNIDKALDVGSGKIRIRDIEVDVTLTI